MAFYMCCVLGCDSRRDYVKLFQFRKTEIGLHNWLKCVSDGAQKSFSDLRKLYVCVKHFEKRFVTSKSRLRRGAYPTLFTAEEISNGIPDTPVRDDSQNYNPNLDHNYCKSKHYDHTYCKIRGSVEHPPGENVTSMCSEEDITLTPCPSHLVDDSALVVASSVSEVLTHKENSDILDTDVPSTCSYEEINPVTKYIATPKKRKCHKRFLHKTSLLTPNCKKLYEEYKNTKRKLNFCRHTKKSAKLLSKELSFEKMTENFTPAAKTLMSMQVSQTSKKKQGRRFSNEEKLYCLCILKQSPKCYRYLQKIFTLPSKVTLNKFICKLQIEAGVNTHIFEAIHREVSTWDEKKKYCSILFDEVALEPGISYNQNRDIIEGFVECNKRTNDFADHALVFMLRGAVHKWDQPVAFYYCKGQTSAIELKQILNEIVTAIIETGLIPVAMICDQGSAFRSALKTLKQESRRKQILAGEVIDDVIILGGYHLSVVFDPPHLFKGIRNNFLKNNVKFNNKISKWSDYVEVYKTDCKHARSRLLHKLNDEHIIPEKIKKMKVKNCTRVFSKTMAATLAYSSEFSNYSDGTPVSPTLKNTAEVTEFLDQLFDSVNGASFVGLRRGKPLRSVVTQDSKHHSFWKEAIEKLKKMTFVDNLGKEKSVPSLMNWIVSLNSFMRLWQMFSKKNIKIMRPRYFNTDVLENFFGQVRAYNYRYNNPDCHTFKNTFRCLLITRFIKFHSNTFNCEEDSGDQLLNMEMLFKSTSDIKSKESPESSNSISVQSYSEIISYDTAGQERINVHSHAYTAGWVIRKTLKNIECSTCESNLLSSKANSIHKWISIKEFNRKINKLTYPAERAVILFKYITQETIEYLEYQPHKQNILKKIKATIKSKYSMDFLKCEVHKNVKENFLDHALRFAIFNWCNSINKIIKGTDIMRLGKELPPMQLKALKRFKIKLKKK